MLTGRRYIYGHKWARDEANIKEILVGWCEEDQRIHVCFET